jgi:hypothetical protein
MAAIDQSVSRLATRWTVRASKLSGGEIFRTRLHRLCGPPSFLYSVTLLEVEQPGGGGVIVWRQPSTPSTAEVKQRGDLHFHALSGPPWLVLGRALPLHLSCDDTGMFLFQLTHRWWPSNQSVTKPVRLPPFSWRHSEWPSNDSQCLAGIQTKYFCNGIPDVLVGTSDSRTTSQ